MQLAAHLADFGGEPGLDGHVDVFQGRVEVELPRLDFEPDFFQPPDDLFRLRRGDDPLAGQHPGVGHGAGEVLAIEALVEAQGGGEVLHRLGGFPGEPSAPGFVGHGHYSLRSEPQDSGGPLGLRAHRADKVRQRFPKKTARG